MKVLWLGGKAIKDGQLKSSGGWTVTLFSQLVKFKDIEVCNIAYGNTDFFCKDENVSFQQYLIPTKYTKISQILWYKNGIPRNKELVYSIQKAIEDFAPDVIHIWGVETFIGAFSLEYLVCKFKVLIEIQGFRGLCADKYYTGLGLSDLCSMFRLAELFKPSLHPVVRRQLFKYWGGYEKKIIRGHHYINTQSEWTRGVIKVISPNAKIFRTRRILRNEFYLAKQWENNNNTHNCFSVLNEESYKCAHILLKAIAEVRKHVPDVTLKIAGIKMRKGINKGYLNYLRNLAKELKIDDIVSWEGMLTADEIINIMHESRVFVYTSSIESFCQVVAEALSIGIPVVSTDSAALREIIHHKENALAFSEGDYFQCAIHIITIMNDSNLSEYLSKNAIKIKSILTHDSISQMQLTTYKDIIQCK